MSWLSIALPNPFKSLQLSDDEQEEDLQRSSPALDDAVSPGSGVKDDFSAIGESIGRQLRGVAAFLAPPPRLEAADGSSSSGVGDADNCDGSSPSSKALAGIRSDLAEIGGSFKTSLSLFSSNSTVAGISKLASNFLQLNEENTDDKENGKGDDDNDYDFESVGITDEVVEFASQISNRPELWTDFPLSLDKEFDLSDVQSEHALVIEQLVPELADLRSRLTGALSDDHFWMIYFILLLPRLNDDDFELLSTPEIVEAREMLLRMLRNEKDTEIDTETPQLSGSSELPNKVSDTTMEKSRSLEKVLYENLNASRSSESNESEDTKKLLKEEDGNKCTSDDHSRSDAKADIIETSRTLCSEEIAGNSNIRTANEEHKNVDNWSEGEKEAVTARTSHAASKHFQSEDDVSFSDLEDDDSDLPNRQFGSRPAQSTRASSPEGSSEWIQLNKNVASGVSQLRDQSSSRDRDSEGDESNDWLTIDDFDP